MSAVSLEHISKSYTKGKSLAVDDISLEVEAGELFGLIGPDGAGKTTLFRILTTVLLADKGRASVDGFDVVKDYRAIRNRVGYMPGKFSLYQDLTIEENLHFFATLFGTTVEKNYELIRDIYDQISPFKQRRAGNLSGGMKQKLALCCALIHRPSVLFLDEPTTGVDVVSRKEFWEMLKKLKMQGITIVVSTPYMDEAVLCERIALMQAGKILSIDRPQQITKDFPVSLFAARSADIYRLMNDYREYAQIETCFAFGEFLHITLIGDQRNGEELLRRYAEAKGHADIVIKRVAASIEDSFIRLMEFRHEGTKTERNTKNTENL